MRWSLLGAWLSSQAEQGQPGALMRTLSSGGGLLVALGLERPQRGLEESLVDPSLEDRDVHLDARGEHIAPLHVHLLGKLGGRQVNGHIGHSSPRERRLCGRGFVAAVGEGMYIASGRRVNNFAAHSGCFGTPWPDG